MSSKIFLINLFGTPVSPSSFNPDNSLAALAGNLKAAGYSPEIIDYQNIDFAEKIAQPKIGEKLFSIISESFKRPLHQSEQKEIGSLNKKLISHQIEIIKDEAAQFSKRILKERPLFIGFKVYSGEGSFFTQLFVQELKRLTSTPIIAGGPLIRVIGKQFLRLYPEFDYLIDGEADLSIVSFARLLEGKLNTEQVRGLIGEKIQNPVDQIRDLNVLADPCYDEDVYPILYKENLKTMIFQIDESRGCPNSCNFCVHPTINDRIFRIVKPEKILNQIRHLQNKFGAMAFRFTGSNTPKKFLNQFSSLIEKEKLNIRYSCYASINTTTNDEIKKLKSTGLAGVFIGVETTDQNILIDTFNKKGQNLERVKSLLNTCLENGVYTTTSWIYPMPGYTPAIREEMRGFISDVYSGYNVNDGSVMVVPSALIPNTEWFQNPQKYGFQIENKDEFYQGYAELNLRFWLPRAQFNNWKYTLNGETFLELASECDRLVGDLSKNQVPQGITDDWMLQGKLSGLSMENFKSQMIQSFLTGDYSSIRRMTTRINLNSKERNWYKEKHNVSAA